MPIPLYSTWTQKFSRKWMVVSHQFQWFFMFFQRIHRVVLIRARWNVQIRARWNVHGGIPRFQTGNLTTYVKQKNRDPFWPCKCPWIEFQSDVSQTFIFQKNLGCFLCVSIFITSGTKVLHHVRPHCPCEFDSRFRTLRRPRVPPKFAFRVFVADCMAGAFTLW